MNHEKDTITQPMQGNFNEENDIIDLVEIFYLMTNHFWQIVYCLFAGGLIAFAITFFMITPKYTATAQLYIVSASNDSVVNLTDLQIGTQLTKDYPDLMLSRPLLEDVIENLSLDMEPKDLYSMIEITNKESTRILKVDVTTIDPQLSADIANELIRQSMIYLPKVMECEQPNVVEEAIVPEGKSSPSYSKNTILGALVVAVIYCAIILIRHLLNDTFVTPEDLERCFGVRPLAVIPEDKIEKVKKHGIKNKG